jgi:P4 family phage/plasmid primase-like protien
MEKVLKSMFKKDLVFFSIDIEQKLNNEGIWKKNIKFPFKWQEFTKETAIHRKDSNSWALVTGKTNNIIVIDIDNVEHWNLLLKKYNQQEPETVKAISGSGGIHLYFKYDDKLEGVKSATKCFGKEYDIDIRTNGGCIICPPSKYFNKNLNKEVEYKWERSILNMEALEIPDWIREILLNKIKINGSEKIEEINEKEECETTKDCGEQENLDLSEGEVEKVTDMLSPERADNYSSWIEVGMCLYNISSDYLDIWKKFSQKSKKYVASETREKWKTFKKNKKGLKTGSLIMWVKKDNPEKYKEFITKKKIDELIKTKYPNKDLIIGDTIESDKSCKQIEIINDKCLIKGDCHQNFKNSNYIEIIGGNMEGFMTTRCRHPECVTKTHCGYIPLSKQEISLVFNGPVSINIGCNMKDDDYLEFQKLKLYEDEKLNEIVYRGLNGKATPFAEIIYYFNRQKYMYSEDDRWFVYKNNKWECLNKKNTTLRYNIQNELTEIYMKVKDYYIEIEGKGSKYVKNLKQLINNFDDTNLKNNIMIELADIYTEKNNENRNFLKKLDANQFLIGFNNGVYDLKNFEFREGKPEDYITMSTGYDYNDKPTEKYDKLIKFLSDIQPNKEELDYFLTYLSTALYGNTLELFTVLTGTGRNGKSKIIELLEKTFGDYYGSIKSQLLTSQIKDGDSPAPGILDLMHKKIVIASETLEGNKLNTGFIKFLTGRDVATFRLCHQNEMVKFRAKFVTLLACNNIPECDNMDNSFSKRLRCMNFPTEFVDEPKENHHKKKDDNINMYFDEWKQDFMLLLISYYKKYIQNGANLKVTDNIMKWTNKYREETDLYLNFLNENTENTNDDNDKVHCSDLYSIFKEWFKFNNPTTKIPSDKEFSKGLKKYKNIDESVRIEKSVKRGVKGLKIKNT